MAESTTADTGTGSTARSRRFLTILFADVCDSTQLADTLEAEHYAELLNGLRRLCREIIPRHGGRIAQLLGDGVVAVFGYPDATEADGRKATEAALQLHQASQSLRLPGQRGATLQLHSGIHSGLVLLGEGDMELGRFELLGTVPNIAARLAAAAQRDEVLVSAETLGPESYFFQTSELRYLSLKGMNTPIAVYRVYSRAMVHTRFEASTHRGLAPFAGRQAEMRVLDLHLQEALRGHPRSLAIAGAAGLGKSRLAEEFLLRATALGCQVHRGYCENEISAEPLQPVLQMLRALLAIDARDAAALVTAKAALSEIDPALLAHESELLRLLVPSTQVAERSDPERTTAAVCAVVRRLAEQRPQVLFIDDWQWADDATRQVLRAINGLSAGTVLTLLSTRENLATDAQLVGTHVIELAPFTKAEAAETIARFLPTGDPFLTEEIFTYSGGNPLFIEELCHSVANDAGSRRLRAQHKGAAWLNTLVESRVARLPTAHAEVLRIAAVIGNVVPIWLLEHLTGLGEDDPLVRSLAERDFLFPAERPGHLRFKHGITRDVVYETVGLQQRESLHSRIAQALEQRSAGANEDAPEVLAYHYAAAGEAQKAARYAELAGDKAVAASALDRAKAQYRAALAALEKLEPSQEIYRRWMTIAQRLGLACVFDASREDLDVFRRAAELARAGGDAQTIARAEYWLGYVSYAIGNSRAALQHCEQALQIARRIGDDPLAVQVRATLGQARAAACDYELALELLEEAIAVKRRHRSGARPAVGFAYSLVCKAHVLGDRGAFEQAHQCFDEALASVQGANHEVEASIRGWQSAVLLWQGRWEDAVQSAEAAYRIGAQVRSLFSFSMAHAAGAYASWMIERTDRSLQALQNATSWLEPRGVGLFRSLNFGWLADGMATSRRVKEARSFAARALHRSRQADLLGVAMAYRALARLAAEQQRIDASRRYLDLALGVARARRSAHEVAVTRLHRAELELDHGDRANVREQLDEASAAFENMQMRGHLQLAQRLYSRL